MSEDPEKNPETDSFYHMEIIMESILALGEIPAALEVVKIQWTVKQFTNAFFFFKKNIDHH